MQIDKSDIQEYKQLCLEQSNIIMTDSEAEASLNEFLEFAFVMSGFKTASEAERLFSYKNNK